MQGLPQVTWEALRLGLLIFAVVLVAAWLLKLVVRRLLSWRGRSPSAASVFGAIAQVVLSVIGFAAALTVIFPSVRPVDVLGGVGILTIAAGIALQTVLGNAFAGIVILSRDRFRVGDQISVGEHAGTVLRISLATTMLRTFDGRQVILPNTIIHTQPVTIQTGYEKVRTTVTLELDQAVDIDKACATAEAAMSALPMVADDPAPRALLSDMHEGVVIMDLRFWSGARQLETREARHAVIRRVTLELRKRGIRLADPSLVVMQKPVGES